ncbi:hypothetical protein [Nesterenkonia xinjiangensis]|uniref:Uncharacterized protein n=1 Tax=Nesterenkonia xinjiangensis TaxID=225327 RepID=A0A7Z0KCB9_9MICC|nr:hypothetical protein [Nesterenkonia xinjiangensis]NYJ78487.1 hypothetical protein [Nesterenkonia xinjiangensis]
MSTVTTEARIEASDRAFNPVVVRYVPATDELDEPEFDPEFEEPEFDPEFEEPEFDPEFEEPEFDPEARSR